MKTDDAAPFHLGSESGKICPISGSPKAPKIASTTQCSRTSPKSTKEINTSKFNKSTLQENLNCRDKKTKLWVITYFIVYTSKKNMTRWELHSTDQLQVTELK